MQSSSNQNSQSGSMGFQDYIKKIQDVCDLYLVKKAPALPLNVKEFIVKYGPYIMIAMMVLSLPAIIALLGLGTLLAPVAALGGTKFNIMYVVSMVFTFAIFVMQGLAISPLLKRSVKGWNILFYANLVSAVHSLINMDLVSLVIGTLISMYFLFQVREYYK